MTKTSLPRLPLWTKRVLEMEDDHLEVIKRGITVQSSRDNRLTRCPEQQHDPFHAHLACGSQLKCKLHFERYCRLQLIRGCCLLLLDAVLSLLLSFSQHRLHVGFSLSNNFVHFESFLFDPPGRQDAEFKFHVYCCFHQGCEGNATSILCMSGAYGSIDNRVDLICCQDKQWQYHLQSFFSSMRICCYKNSVAMSENHCCDARQGK